MKNTVTQLILSASLCASSTLVMAGATPSPIATPVMGPWSLGLMAGLVALIAYRIKRK